MLSIQLDNEEVVISISTDNKCVKQIIIPPRSEIICPIVFNIKDDSITQKKELSDGVFIASAIIPEGISHVKILNTTNKVVYFDHIHVKTEPL